MTVSVGSRQFSPQWPVFLQRLEERHFADLTFSEVTRALRALSSAYVERRESALAERKALDGAGKRAAFALYYGPIHFLLVQHIARELGVAPHAGTVVDLGCGTGVAGAAIATLAAPPLPVLGIDTHPWTLEEARFTYQTFGLRFDVRRGHAARSRFPSDTSFVVAAFVVNELTATDRSALLKELMSTSGSRISASAPQALRRDLAAARSASEGGPAPGSRLIIEPISRRVSPWWPEWEREFLARGGRSDEWKFRIDMPPIVKRLAKAAGLRPDVLTARSLFL